VWLVAVGLLHIFENGYGTRVILVASVVIPAVMVMFAYAASRRITISLGVPDKCECGEKINVKITIKNNGLLLGYLKCRIRCENLLTGEKSEEDLALNSRHHDFSTDSMHCGMVIFSIIKPSVVDMFGIYVWKLECETCGNALVMPEAVSALIDEWGEQSVLDGDEYSTLRSGNDPSETFAIREYMPGDMLKSIHWKLSEKTDKLLVREMGLPVGEILILIETSTGGIETPEPGRISEMVGVAFSISNEFALRGIVHTVGWLDTASLRYASRKVTCINELNEVFAELLANTVKSCVVTAVEAYAAQGSLDSQPIILSYENYNGVLK